MNRILILSLLIGMTLGIPAPLPAFAAGTGQQSTEEHGAHHPEGAEAQSGTSDAPAAGPEMGMLGGTMGMMGMMRMMQGGGMMMGGMPFQHVDGRLAFLKAELKITSAQEPQWTKFADAYRVSATQMKSMHEQMIKGMGRGGMGMPGQAAPMQGMAGGQGGTTTGMGMNAPTTAQPTAVEKLSRTEQMLSGRLDAVRAMKAALEPLYATLDPEQKKTADELLGGMGMM